ncbi:unnamed protein product, partial [Rangifer tarandus platyrhynchus]
KGRERKKGRRKKRSREKEKGRDLINTKGTPIPSSSTQDNPPSESSGMQSRACNTSTGEESPGGAQSDSRGRPGEG